MLEGHLLVTSFLPSCPTERWVWSKLWGGMSHKYSMLFFAGDLTVILRTALKPRYLLLFLKLLHIFLLLVPFCPDQAVFCRYLGLLHELSHPSTTVQGAAWRCVFYSLWAVVSDPEQDLHRFAQASHCNADPVPCCWVDLGNTSTQREEDWSITP